MLGALWPATLEYFLSQMMDPVFQPVQIENLREYAAADTIRAARRRRSGWAPPLLGSAGHLGKPPQALAAGTGFGPARLPRHRDRLWFRYAAHLPNCQIRRSRLPGASTLAPLEAHHAESFRSTVLRKRMRRASVV
jgi:hypothetical protein